MTVTHQYDTLKNEKLRVSYRVKQSLHNLIHNFTMQSSSMCANVETCAYVGFVTYSFRAY